MRVVDASADGVDSCGSCGYCQQAAGCKAATADMPWIQSMSPRRCRTMARDVCSKVSGSSRHLSADFQEDKSLLQSPEY